MSWFKIDDKLPGHRKARHVRRSHPAKRRDVAPFGLWAIAGALSDDGFIALEVLEEWDDDAARLADRLVAAGLWYAVERDGEPGYEFHDWTDNNPAAAASSSGTYGNHVRHHEKRGIVKLDCDHCHPTSPRLAPDVAPESHPTIGGEVAPDSLPVPSRPVPTRPDPGNPSRSRSMTEGTPDGFDAWWDAYEHKVARRKAETAYRAALRKPGVTPDLLLAAATSYIAWVKAEGKFPQFAKHPTTWLNGECWRDERPAIPMPMSRAQQGLEVARRLHEAEQTDPIPFPQIGGPR